MTSVAEVEAALARAAPPRTLVRDAPRISDAPFPVSGIWRDSAEVRAFTADLLAGVEMNPACYNLAHKAAREGHATAEVVAALSSLLDTSEAVTSRPERVRE